jgi:DNA-binding PadR family transcriptional regulator
MSSTRLLVLGAIRFMQPVHGYDVRRELISWRLEELANVKPGSIYGAIRTLHKDNCISIHAQKGGVRRPERTSYVLTADGEKEFFVLLRENWWTVTTAAEPLIPALCLMPFLPREELIAAVQARATRLDAQLGELALSRTGIRSGATGADGEIPDHVREILDFTSGRIRAELDWSRTFLKRLRGGEYRFTGEGKFPALGPGQGWSETNQA